MRSLIDGIHKNNVSIVLEVLSRSPDLLKNHKWRHVPLKNALLLEANEVIIELLIEYGANINIRNLLNVVIEQCSLEYIEILLKSGALLEGPHWMGKSPAEFVFSRDDNVDGKKEILHLLVKYGLDVSFRNRGGDNLLHLFIYTVAVDDFDAVEVAEILLDAGVALEEQDYEQNYTPLSAAIYSENFDLVSYLLNRGANIMDGMLVLAAKCNDIDIVDLLIRSGADVDDKNHLQWTALHEACLQHDEQLIRLLIQRGAEISPVDKRGRTPFSLLNPDEVDYDGCLVSMVEKFSLLSFENLPISGSDANFIQDKPMAPEHFEKCIAELGRLSSTEFVHGHSFYSVLKMSIGMKKLAKYATNEELVLKFEENLRQITYYTNDLLNIWEQAIRTREKSEAVTSTLHSILDDFLPDKIILKLTENLTLEDFQLE